MAIVVIGGRRSTLPFEAEVPQVPGGRVLCERWSQFYLYVADVSVPILGTGLVQTPEMSGVRSIVHFIFFALAFYFGFVRKPS
jgi:hypothetical protein